MKCDEARTLVSRQMDGELPAEEAPALEAHLAQCPDCRQYARRCRALQEAIEGVAAPAAPAPRLPALVSRAGGRAARRLAFYRAATGALAAACVVLAVLLHVRGRGVEMPAGGEGTAGIEIPAPSAAMLHAGGPEEWRSEPVPAFLALDDYFAGGLEWLAQDGRQTEMGVRGYAGPTEAAAAGPTVLVDIRVAAVSEGGGVKPLSGPALMIKPGVEAHFRLAESGGGEARRLAYRCAYSASGAGLVQVDLEIAPQGAGEVPVRLFGTVRVGDDGDAPAAYARIGTAGYVLFLSAARLEKRVPQASAGQT